MFTLTKKDIDTAASIHNVEYAVHHDMMSLLVLTTIKNPSAVEAYIYLDRNNENYKNL